MISLLSLLVSLSFLLLCPVHATIIISGRKFFNSSNGTQFYFKGVVYSQITGEGKNVDVLANPEQCALDAPLMKRLGANVVSVYSVDPTKDHDGCMKVFGGLGVQVVVNLDGGVGGGRSLKDEPWSKEVYERYISIVDGFREYENLLVFIVGNEIVTSDNDTSKALTIKAAARDVKAHMRNKHGRSIPVGYFAKSYGSSSVETTVKLAEFLVCNNYDTHDDNDNDTNDAAIDFLGLNVFSWCGESTFEESGYVQRTQDFQHLPIPIFLSETGCHDERPRRFLDQPVVFGPEMRDVWSGAMVFEWLQEDRLNYGLVSYSKPNVISGTPTPLPDYDNLKSQWATLSSTGINSADYTLAGTTPPCPTVDGIWTIAPTAKLPVVDDNNASSLSWKTIIVVVVSMIVIAVLIGFFVIYRRHPKRTWHSVLRGSGKLGKESGRERLLDEQGAFLGEDELALFDIGEHEDDEDHGAGGSNRREAGHEQ